MDKSDKRRFEPPKDKKDTFEILKLLKQRLKNKNHNKNYVAKHSSMWERSDIIDKKYKEKEDQYKNCDKNANKQRSVENRSGIMNKKDKKHTVTEKIIKFININKRREMDKQKSYCLEYFGQRFVSDILSGLLRLSPSIEEQSLSLFDGLTNCEKDVVMDSLIKQIRLNRNRVLKCHDVREFLAKMSDSFTVEGWFVWFKKACYSADNKFDLEIYNFLLDALPPCHKSYCAKKMSKDYEAHKVSVYQKQKVIRAKTSGKIRNHNIYNDTFPDIIFGTRNNYSRNLYLHHTMDVKRRFNTLPYTYTKKRVLRSLYGNSTQKDLSVTTKTLDFEKYRRHNDKNNNSISLYENSTQKDLSVTTRNDLCHRKCVSDLKRNIKFGSSYMSSTKENHDLIAENIRTYTILPYRDYKEHIGGIINFNMVPAKGMNRSINRRVIKNSEKTAFLKAVDSKKLIGDRFKLTKFGERNLGIPVSKKNPKETDRNQEGKLKLETFEVKLKGKLKYKTIRPSVLNENKKFNETKKVKNKDKSKLLMPRKPSNYSFDGK